MKETGIIFSGEMVRAILDGRKTQTRRTRGLDAVNADPDRWRLWGPGLTNDCWIFTYHPDDNSEASKATTVRHPYGAPGDRLWVRESFRPASSYGDECNTKLLAQEDVYYKADDKFTAGTRWRTAIFMPRNLSRITLEITGVRVERVQRITEMDACAEGVTPEGGMSPAGDKYRSRFANLWDSINAKRGYGWDTNCWVWVVEFRRVRL